MADHHKQNGVHLEKDKRDPDENVSIKPPNLGKREASTATAILSFLAVILAIICAVFRTSLYHHDQAFWISSGDFIARMWGSFYDYFDGNRAKMGIALYCLSVLGHFLLGGLLLITDLTGRPKFIAKYKTQLDQIEQTSCEEALWTAFLNLTIYTFPVLVGFYFAIVWRGCGSSVEELPTFQSVLYEFAVLSVVEEIGFYYSHRLLHHPSLYKRFHKAHHEWTAPLGIVSFHSHPFEHFLANILPVGLGVVITGSHMLVASLWLTMALGSSTVSHSGYHLPLLQSPEFHDYHHLKFTNNFGVFGILDWLHGTDAKFRKTKQFQRHKVLLGIKPMNDIFPDNPK